VIGLFGGSVLTRGPQALGEADDRLVPIGQPNGHLAHQAPPARPVAGAILGDGEVQQGRGRGVAERQRQPQGCKCVLKAALGQ
jgi:hypothetical protein